MKKPITLKTLLLFRKLTAVLLFMLCMNGMVHAQSLDWEVHFPVTDAPSPYSELPGVLDLATNAAGDVFVLSIKKDTSVHDYYLSRYSASGALLWRKPVPSSGQLRIVLDLQSNCYISGTVVNDFYDVNKYGVHKFDANGNLVWTRKITRSLPSDPHNMWFGDLVYDSFNDQIAVSGMCSGTWDFDPRLTTHLISGPSFDRTSFIWKINSSGDLVWAKDLGWPDQDYSNEIDFDGSGNIYIGGANRTGQIDLDPDAGVQFNASVKCAYNVKLNSNGQFVWAREFAYQGNFFCYFIDMTADASGNVTNSLEYMGSMDADPGAATDWVVKTEFTTALFKLSSSGNYVWSRSFNWDHATDMYADAQGAIHLMGYQAQGDLDLPVGNQVMHFQDNRQGNSQPNHNFYYSIDANGVGVALEYMEVGSYIYPYQLGISSNGSIAIGGYAYGPSIHFDAPSGPVVTFPNNTYMAFVAKYQPCTPVFGSTMNLDYCVSGVSPSGIFDWRKPGVYTDIFQNVMGCDSFVTCNVNLQEINIGLYYNHPIYTYVSAEIDSIATFQWLNCNNGYLPVSGETYPYFRGVNGVYSAALEITINGCKDTTHCVNVAILAVEDVDIDIKLYPNPSHGEFQVEATGIEEINVYNPLGQRIKATYALSGEGAHVRLNAAPGVYFVNVKTTDGAITKRIILN